jgi:uncharacterized protein (DUF3084 family)
VTQAHKKEIREREETIADKESRITDLEKKNQELEKFKFVLNYKIQVSHHWRESITQIIIFDAGIKTANNATQTRDQ